jgi:hypothetical protein
LNGLLESSKAEIEKCFQEFKEKKKEEKMNEE